MPAVGIFFCFRGRPSQAFPRSAPTWRNKIWFVDLWVGLPNFSAPRVLFYSLWLTCSILSYLGTCLQSWICKSAVFYYYVELAWIVRRRCFINNLHGYFVKQKNNGNTSCKHKGLFHGRGQKKERGGEIEVREWKTASKSRPSLFSRMDGAGGWKGEKSLATSTDARISGKGDQNLLAAEKKGWAQRLLLCLLNPPLLFPLCVIKTWAAEMKLLN